jgi:hypothetical protein
MISMRYAWNVSHGSGLVWNPGERVEGMRRDEAARWAASLVDATGPLLAQVVSQLTRPARVTQAPQRLALDLANALAGQPEFLADLLQRV